MVYHCIVRVVERRMAFGQEEKEQFRSYLRLYESFSGCRVLAYCVMGNHAHLLVEVPPPATSARSDKELLQHLGVLYHEEVVAGVARELADLRHKVKLGEADEALVQQVHERYTYRMHSLSQFMKSVMQRFTQWFNRKHDRSGGLWEDAYKSVLVELGTASRIIAAYIDLNPVRAGIVKDPAEYRWCSYGEAMGGWAKGGGKMARAGLVRAIIGDAGGAAGAPQWTGKVAKDYRILLLAGGAENLPELAVGEVKANAKRAGKGVRKTAATQQEPAEQSGDLALGRMLRTPIRYFTDGAVIGSREFVDGVFHANRDQFSDKRKSGARKLRGNAAAASGVLWSVRNLTKRIV